MTNFLKHHPDSNMLVEFSAGSLDIAPSLCVSAHLHFCAKCRSELSKLDEIGSHFLSQSNPTEVNEQLFENVMNEIDRTEHKSTEPELDETLQHFPAPIKKLITAAKNTLTWQRLSSSIDRAKLLTGQNKFEVALHRIKAGATIPKHDHRGTEYTVVLKGSFSDEQSVYTEGDFVIRSPGDVHQPMGAKHSDCICLSAVDAPVKLTSPLGFLFRPWLKINPM